MQSNVEMVESLYAAFTHRDVAMVLSLMSPDIQVVQSSLLPWGGRYSGHDGVKKFFATLMQHVNSNVTVERMIDAGDHVVAIGRTKGTVLANQKMFNVPVAHVWHVSEGRLAAFYPYIDNKLMLEALRD